jgi:hypothetical protein
MSVAAGLFRLHFTGIVRTAETHMKHHATTLIGALTLYAVSPAGFAAAPPDDVRETYDRFGRDRGRQPLQPRQARLDE